MNILLVEDDPELARQIAAQLGRAHHPVKWCASGREGLAAASRGPFDVLILDVGLPDTTGFELVQELRNRDLRVPVLFLTARAAVTDRVRGLAAGGDDYLTKPFAIEELLARLEALHRRATRTAESERRKVGRWTLDATMRRLLNGTEVVQLQPREWTLLQVLLQHEGRVLTKHFLLEKAWDIHFDPGSNVVDVTICKLRAKLDEPGRPSFIRNIRGKGYVFQDLPR